VRGCLGFLILLPFAGAWWLTIKIVDASIKKSDALRPLGILISLAVGGGSVYAGYYIGPIVGWFIMAVGVIVAIVGTWRSLAVTRYQVEQEELTERLEKERKEEAWRAVKEIAKGMLAQDRIDDLQTYKQIVHILEQEPLDGEASDLVSRLNKLKKKQDKIR